MQQAEHVISWYAAMLLVYAEAARIGISVAHIEEYYLERWWGLSIIAHRAATTETAM